MGVKKLLLPILLLIFSCEEPAINGCTTTTACNYNINADKDDGSCIAKQGCNEWCEGDTTIVLEIDCIGECGGVAAIDSCNVCSGGTTNFTPCIQDCLGAWGGIAVADSCGVCAGSGIADGTCDCDGNILDCSGECGGTNICGCNDTTAINYDSTATFNDGSCEFDTTAPTVVITFPVNNSILDSITTIKADVADNNDIISVLFLIDGAEAYADSTAPYEYVWDVCMRGTDNHTVLVKAEDITGNQGQSDVNTYTLNASYDCESVCGGDATLDICEVCNGGISDITECTECPSSITIDCNGVCGGDNVLDNCGTCDSDSNNDCPADCNGDYGGTAVLDVCGVCDSDSTNDGVMDNCDVCDNDSTNDCNKDCADVWGGTSWVSDCGCVSATNSGDDCDDCAGTPNGTANTDNYGNCCAGIASGYCDCNSEYVELWGECYSIENTTEIGRSGDWGVNGDIPPEIGNLTNLTYLNLHSTLLTGSIPPEIGQLTNLTYLSLSHTQLTGAIPSEIGNLINLTGIWLSNTQITGEIPVEIGNLTNLEEIYLYTNQLVGEIPIEIGNLTNLRNLNLRENSLTGTIPSEIGNLTNLGFLFLNNNQLTGEIPQSVCDLIESNNLNMGSILGGNENLINTCD